VSGPAGEERGGKSWRPTVRGLEHKCDDGVWRQVDRVSLLCRCGVSAPRSTEHSAAMDLSSELEDEM